MNAPNAPRMPLHGRAIFAADPAQSRGRLIEEDACATRSPFQRDRDRIVHCNAFRRLTYKTQVFLHHEGDLFRTRLTHSIEVAQITRALARGLALDEDLAEAIALAHDLGHPPFGHAGERALDSAMADHGGFDHNAQSLKQVTKLEHRYAAFDGLNLTWETLEGLVKHNGPIAKPSGFLARYNAQHDLELHQQAGLEAQIAALADDIAYNNHDLDDGLRAGLLDVSTLRDVPICARQLDDVLTGHPDLSEEKLFYEVNRRMITTMITDVLGETRRRLAKSNPQTMGDIQNTPQRTADFSDAMKGDIADLRAFLFERVYRHPNVMRVMDRAADIVTDLAAAYLSAPETLPGDWGARAANQADPAKQADIVRDFIAGMTDRYAVRMHEQLFDHTPDLR